MADPVAFAGHNKRFVAAPEMTDTRTLHVYTNGVENISCWKLSPDELAIIARTGEVWMSIKSGEVLHPAYIGGAPMMEALDPDTNEQTTYYSDGRHVVEDARRFATLHHGDQMYGDHPYVAYHTHGVALIMAEYTGDYRYLAACYLHDVEEDCFQALSWEDRRAILQARFGYEIELIVWCCTGLMYVDGVKQNRAARNLQIYAKVNQYPRTAVAKMSDRLFNMEECVRTKGPMGGVYLKETVEFDVNVGVHCPLAMRLRMFEAAMAIAHYTHAKPEVVALVSARYDTILGQMTEATQAA